MNICGGHPGAECVAEVSMFSSIEQDVSAKEILEIASRGMVWPGKGFASFGLDIFKVLCCSSITATYLEAAESEGQWNRLR